MSLKVAKADDQKTDLAVVILQKNESLHIKRCLEKLAPLNPEQVFVVDCFSTDGSDKIATAMGATVIYHEWSGNQAAQFNWFIDTQKIESEWVLRLDADEWLTPELIEEVKVAIRSLSQDVVGIVLKRRNYFAGGWVKHGTYPVRILRLFRAGHARYADHMVMDEHLLVEGRTEELQNDFVDESLLSMAQWREKHRGYAKREARQAQVSMRTGEWTDHRKARYYRMPRYFRALVYFSIRYFVRLGFLDGYAGWMWNFWQGLWYRWIVDLEIGRLESGEKEC